MAIEDRREKLRVTADQLEAKIGEHDAAIRSTNEGDRRRSELGDEIAALRKRLLEIDKILYGCG